MCIAIPREFRDLINTVCENALITSYAGKAESVRPEVIDEVAKDLRLNVFSRPATVMPAVTWDSET